MGMKLMPSVLRLYTDTDGDATEFTFVGAVAEGYSYDVRRHNKAFIEPDCVDSDDDNDGVADSLDAFSLIATEWKDTDNDGTGDFADAAANDDASTTDSDADGVADESDAFPSDTTEWADTDQDDLGDNAERIYSEYSILPNGQFDDENVVDIWTDHDDLQVIDGAMHIGSRAKKQDSPKFTATQWRDGHSYRFETHVKLAEGEPEAQVGLRVKQLMLTEVTLSKTCYSQT